MQKKEKVAKAILKSKTIVEGESKSRHKMSTRTVKRKVEEGVDLEPESKRQKLDVDQPGSLLLSKEILLRR